MPRGLQYQVVVQESFIRPARSSRRSYKRNWVTGEVLACADTEEIDWVTKGRLIRRIGQLSVCRLGGLVCVLEERQVEVVTLGNMLAKDDRHNGVCDSGQLTPTLRFLQSSQAFSLRISAAFSCFFFGSGPCRPDPAFLTGDRARSRCMPLMAWDMDGAVLP
jgi:hypothetical protein